MLFNLFSFINLILKPFFDRLEWMMVSANTILCHNLRSLCDAPSLKYVRELNSIYIWYCGEIEDILSFSYTFPLQSLKVVELQYLDNLQVLFREEKVASAPAVPPGTFSRLTKFSIFRCPNIKNLFTPGLLPNLGNLEEIDVRCCEQLEEIIGGESDEDKEREAEEEIEEAGMGSNGIFRKLRVLALSDLPELKTICNGSNVIVCDSVQQIWIGQCPKLKRLPLSLPQTNGQLSSPPSSLRIEIKKEWWELLEWGNHDTTNVLEPYCQFFE